MPKRIAFMPLDTYPEAAPDPAILAAVNFAAALNCGLHVSTFAVDIPPATPRLGGFLLDVEGMARAAEERSKSECQRLRRLVEDAAASTLNVDVESRRLIHSATDDAAVIKARYFDLAVLPWAAETPSVQEMAQSLVFGSGLPVILVPPSPRVASVSHIAIAWDESRVAARALGDALRLLAAGSRITVLTVQDEKKLSGSVIAQTLAASLASRGHSASAVEMTLQGRTIAAALQESALAEGAQLLAMGGFGHSRLRDFILGGATKGVFGDLRMPVLLAH